jgi:hypothetical protein
MPCLDAIPSPLPRSDDRYEPKGIAELWLSTAAPWERLLSAFALGPPPTILLQAWVCNPWLHRLIAHRRARHWSQHWALRNYSTRTPSPVLGNAGSKICKVWWIGHR